MVYEAGATTKGEHVVELWWFHVRVAAVLGEVGHARETKHLLVNERLPGDITGDQCERCIRQDVCLSPG
jgi:hypothetical protein